MNYAYVAYTPDKKLVKGKVSATSEDNAASLLSYGGYHIVSLKQTTPFINTEKLAATFTRIKPGEIIMFSRQLALLLESGTDIVTALELLQSQVTNRTLQRIVREVVSDIRGGSSLSTALSKHPQAFSQMYYRAIASGEQSGNLELVLRRVADHMERSATTSKKVKNALTYPIILTIAAFVVIAIMVSFVLPSFTVLYSSFDVELPAMTRILMGTTEWMGHYGIYIYIVILVAFVIGYAYVRTPTGRYQWDALLLRLPLLGRIFQLNELSRHCRTIALLFKVGIPLPEIMAMVVQGSNNRIIAEALKEVQEDLIRGEGLSRPMSKRPIFLPLMVQMIAVGEETGKLDDTLDTVAQTYEAEADDKTSGAVGLIQPAMTVIIGLIIAFVALSLVTTVYSIYSQVSL